MGRRIDDGETGRIVPADDERALAVVLGQLLRDRDLRASLGARAFALIQDKYTPETVMRRLDAIYREILDRRSPRVVA